MSRSTDNLGFRAPSPPPRWPPEQGYEPRRPSNSGRNRVVVQPLFPGPPTGVAPNPNGGFLERWLVPAEERGVVAGPLGLASFPVPARSPLHALVFNELVGDLDPSFRGSIPVPLARLEEGQQWMNMQVPAEQGEDSRLTQDEQNKALMRLKKEIYNPVPKRLFRRLSLYYRDNSRNILNEKRREEDDEDSKRCAICLDDFEPRQLVMLTPCNHMFHEECIVPWVKSRGQCPVCRFVI